ncbi:MAG: MFS transporter, partial [Actinobacteria bacterium]|nr:MFS transporter [Actinomycetota bacterium]
ATAAEVGIAGAFHVNKLGLGIIISGAALGAIVSAALIGFLADRIGRRPTISIAILVFSLATAAAALAQNVPQLLVARVIAGIGFGGLLPMAWAFGSEIAPAASRGRVLAWLNAFYGGGGALAYLIGLAVIVPLGWRWGFAIFLLPALLALVVVRFMP